jgi:hypothetical protein
VPADGGVPLSPPLAERDNHDGSETAGSEKLYGVWPPMAFSVVENSLVAVHGPRVEEVVRVSPGFTVTINGRVCDTPRESVAVALKVKFVGALTTGAVPLSIAPLCDSHAGRFTNDHVMAPVPPVDVNVCE